MNVTTELHTIDCATCCIVFAVPERFERNRREDHASFYCPVGHHNYFAAETDLERAQRLLAEQQARHVQLIGRLDQAKARADHERARANGYKGALTRAGRRISRGVCPCCHRQFDDVDRHMASKHPRFVNEHQPNKETAE